MQLPTFVVNSDSLYLLVTSHLPLLFKLFELVEYGPASFKESFELILGILEVWHRRSLDKVIVADVKGTVNGIAGHPLGLQHTQTLSFELAPHELMIVAHKQVSDRLVVHSHFPQAPRMSTRVSLLERIFSKQHFPLSSAQKYRLYRVLDQNRRHLFAQLHCCLAAEVYAVIFCLVTDHQLLTTGSNYLPLGRVVLHAVDIVKFFLSFKLCYFLSRGKAMYKYVFLAVEHHLGLYLIKCYFTEGILEVDVRVGLDPGEGVRVEKGDVVLTIFIQAEGKQP